MKTIILLATSIVVARCDIETKGFFPDFQDGQMNKNGIPAELKRENRLGASSAKCRFPVTRRTPPTKRLKLSKEQQTGLDGTIKEIAVESKNLHTSIVENNSALELERLLSRVVLFFQRGQTEQIFQDDESSARAKRQVLKDFKIKNSTWKHGVFYTFNTTDHLIRRAFKKGVKVWTDLTCIDFVEYKKAIDKVVVVEKDGSWSSIGQRGEDQSLSLGRGYVTVGTAVHEIGHVLGLFHTMARPDRDSHIKIVKENLDPRHINDFGKENSHYVDVYGLQYDYGSIMHYDELSGSVNNLPTMIAKEPLYQKTMGSEIISFSDIFVINEHHGCNAKCKKKNATSAKCVNGGFPHPRNCSICICPGGYGGTLCDQRPSGCGEDLVATREKQTADYRLGSGFSLKDQFEFCYYMIRAPEQKKIEVVVQSISSGFDIGGCPNGGVEIKAQVDKKMTGYRFCSMKGTRGPVISSTNILPVILFNKLGSMHVIFTFRYID